VCTLGTDKFMNDVTALLKIFSMSVTTPQDELKGKSAKRNPSTLVKLDEEGVVFRSYLNGDKITLTPESAIQAQKYLHSDIIITLDILLPLNISKRKLLESFHRTHRWEARSLAEHLKNPQRQAIYCVLHGGTDIELRLLSFQYLSQLPFDGFAIGGSLGRTKDDMNDVLKALSPHLQRTQKPIHLLGIGDPNGILLALGHGIDTFDSCFPTRTGRHGTLLSESGYVNITKNEFKDKFSRPPVLHCSCLACTHYSAAYLHHLYKVHEPAGMMLGTLHNLHFILEKMRQIREMIKDNKI
jgi:queuine tRNA-ribosyltransferase